MRDFVVKRSSCDSIKKSLIHILRYQLVPMKSKTSSGMFTILLQKVSRAISFLKGMCYFSENVFRVNLGHLDLQAREVTRGEMRHISHFQDQKVTRASEEILVYQVFYRKQGKTYSLMVVVDISR